MIYISEKNEVSARRSELEARRVESSGDRGVTSNQV